MSWVGRGCPGPRQAGILLGRRRSVPGGGRLDFAGGFLQYRSARRFPSTWWAARHRSKWAGTTI